MPTIIERNQTIHEGVVVVELALVSKDQHDEYLTSRFGDIVIDPSGAFEDVADAASKFTLHAGPPVYFFKAGALRAVFDDTSLGTDVLQKRAKIWGDKMQADLKSAMAALRLKSDLTSTSTFVL